jgi:ssDNA-binding Zn-finger/Zn-ribbon topoisomerase 1
MLWTTPASRPDPHDTTESQAHRHRSFAATATDFLKWSNSPSGFVAAGAARSTGRRERRLGAGDRVRDSSSIERDPALDLLGLDAPSTIPRMLGQHRVTKLSDRFGDYTLIVRCTKCKHQRSMDPEALARLVGWETPVEQFATRLRCSTCGATCPDLLREPIRRPRGVPKNPH